MNEVGWISISGGMLAVEGVFIAELSRAGFAFVKKPYFFITESSQILE